MKEQQQRERAKRKIEAARAEERARKIKPPPLVPPSEPESSTSCKAHTNSNNKKDKSAVKVTTSLSSGHKTVPPVSIKGHAPKHKEAAGSSSSQQAAGVTTKQQPASKPLDFKQLMKIASENKNGNKSKELVQQVLSSNKKSTVPSPHKTPMATTQKPVKRVEQAGTKQSKSVHPAKQVSTDHRKLPSSKSTSTALPQQRASSGTATKPVARVGSKTDPKPPSVKLKTGSFYQSSAIGSEWSDMKKTLKKPQLQRRLNGFNISGSWINELGLTQLPTNLDSDYDDDDDDLSDFVASDADEDAEDYSAAIRDIFGYDKRKFCDNDTEVMESSYSQQQFEEKRSAHIGKQEDAEDIRRELEEMRRKKRKKIKLK